MAGTTIELTQRPRRLRAKEASRRLIRETRLSLDSLVMPLFVRPGRQVRAPIASLPGQFQLSIDQLVKECQQLYRQGISSVLLFGAPGRDKDERGSGAYTKDGIVQEAVRAVKDAVPELFIITDVCLCAYTTHGHCGIVHVRGGTGAKRSNAKKGSRNRSAGQVRYASNLTEEQFVIDNDATLELLGRTAVSLASAGADMVAPSDMMDGNVAAVRAAMDAANFQHLPIMAYSAKFASSFYGPFREAVDAAPGFGDRRSYQMDGANAEEALREVRLDLEQGADIVMIKPALPYLDIIYRVKETFGCPVAAYSVSGEYAMLKAAATRGWLQERSAWLEVLLSIQRAGADIVITYWAREASRAVLGRLS